MRPQGWKERFEQSRGWAAWAPGLSQAILSAWEDHKRDWYERQEEALADQAAIKALGADWETHLRQDHRPFRQDCAICLEASAKQRPHYRQDHPSVFTMSMDVAGPFPQGIDSDGKTKQRYLLVASNAVPILQEGEFVWTESCTDTVGG